MAKTTKKKESGQGGTQSALGKHGKQGKQAAKGKGTLKSPAQARLERRANDEKIVKTIRYIFVAVVVAAVIGVGVGIGLFIYKPPVATVGGMPIKQYEFAYFMSAAKQQYEQYAQYGIEGDSEQYRNNALQQALDMRIHEAKAKERGITLTDDDKANMDTMLNTMLPQYAQQSGVSTSRYIRASFGVSLSDYRKLLNVMFLTDRLSNTLMDEAVVADEEALAKYEADPDHYKEVTVRHVLFLFEGLDEESPRTQDQSKLLAETTLQRIRNGEDIGALAEELTEDTASASSGGEYTFRADDAYEEGFKDWAFAAEIGDTGIAETSYGYHVMQLDAKRTTYEEFKEDIISEVKQDAVIAKYDEWREDPMYEVVKNEKVFESFT